MSQSPPRPVLLAYSRAMRSQFNPKMLVLSVIPLVLALVMAWFVFSYGYQPLLDAIQALFDKYGLFQYSNSMLGKFGMGMLKTIVVPLALMILLLPLTMIMSMLFMNIAAMPVIVKHVAARQFPALEEKHGGSFFGGIRINLVTMLMFVPLWLLTLPLYVFPPLAVLVQAILFGRLNARVMAYDALADHASAEEFSTIVRTRAHDLTLIGVFSGLAASLPGLVWIGGAVTPLFFILAPLSVWLFIMVFIFSAMWFLYYCMQALHDLRAARAAAEAVAFADPERTHH